MFQRFIFTETSERGVEPTITSYYYYAGFYTIILNFFLLYLKLRPISDLWTGFLRKLIIFELS